MAKKTNKPVTLCISMGSTRYHMSKLSESQLKFKAAKMLKSAKKQLIEAIFAHVDARYQVSEETQTINVELKVTIVPSETNKTPF